MSASEVEAYIRDRGAFYGTVSRIAETIEEYVALGCSGFMVYLNRYFNPAPDIQALQQLSGLVGLAIARMMVVPESARYSKVKEPLSVIATLARAKTIRDLKVAAGI